MIEQTILEESDVFKKQIKEDISVLQDNLKNIDPRILKDEYAFNYWILSRIYSIDEELIPSNITEYNDKNIDCFVYHENSKELYIVQNKYYSENDPIKRNDVSDFLMTPLTQLLDGKYKSKELQNAFNEIYQDPEAKIYLHFNAANNKENIDSKKNIESFNVNPRSEIKALTIAKYNTLDDLYDLYYGRNYEEKISFTYNLKTINKGTFASLREEYGITGICEAYYIITPISEIYNMYEAASNKNYQLFEENIREYLGVGSKTSINNGIIQTLKNENERKNFLYYNNGITITCSDIEKDTPEKSKRNLPLVQPQIVNGCQTVNSIVEVLKNYSSEEIEAQFSQVYLMVKALIIPDLSINENKEFASNVVKYTNRQNAVSEKAFASNINYFYRFQKEFEKRGFILLVKPSDKNKYKDYLKDHKDELMYKAQKYADSVGYNNFKPADLAVDLEKLLQIYVALKEDGYKAYKCKPEVLKQDSNTYLKYSLNIEKDLSCDNMIRLYLFYKRAEYDQKQSEDRKSPIPYYLLGFLNKFLNKQNVSYSHFFLSDVTKINTAYQCLSSLTQLYRMNYLEDKKIEYNNMIKNMIDDDVLTKSIRALEVMPGGKFPNV